MRLRRAVLHEVRPYIGGHLRRAFAADVCVGHLRQAFAADVCVGHLRQAFAASVCGERYPPSLQILDVLHYLVDVIVVMGIDVVLVPSLGIVNDIFRDIIMGALVADDMIEITLLP